MSKVMNTMLRSFLAIGALGLTTALVPAQDEPKAVKPPAVSELIEQLGARDYQSRRTAESSLRARGSEALDALRKAAADDSDAEIQWRARRLVRQIESGSDGRLQRRGSPPQPAAPNGQRWPPGFGNTPDNDADLERVFGDMFERLERDFGVDVPRGRFFQDDFFKSLQQQMEDMRRGAAMGLPGSGQAFNMRIGPDGVRVEITEKAEDGKSDTKVYEAPDVKTFRDKYPEIAQRYLRDSGPTVWGFGGRLPGVFRSIAPLPPVDPNDYTAPMGDAAIVDNGERLGVLVEALSPELRDFLQLEPGVGLRVQSVNDGSLAQTLGLAEGDVLLEVAGKQIGTPIDVREALRGVEVGAKVTVKVNRRGRDQVLEATKPAAPKPLTKKLEKREPATSEGSKAIR